jgi:hypothetical protein
MAITIKQLSTFDELIYNGENPIGKTIYYNNLKKVIKHIKVIKGSRQLQVHCVDGTIFLCNQDKEFYFDLLTVRTTGKPTLPKLNGK